MGRSPCCEKKMGLKKGPWTPEEDQKLIACVEKHGNGSWRAMPAKAGLRRCGKSCRLRWINYLRPDIIRGNFSLKEEQTIIQLHALLGNRWSTIASHLPKRTDNEIKNYWNTKLKKKFDKMGIDPTTHKPKIESSLVDSKDGSSNLGHMAQWESARLEAEARLVRESKLQQQQTCRLVLKKITTQQQQPSSTSWSNNNNNNKNSSLTTTTNEENKTMHVHSMYAMMLATDHDDLDSSASTLCFPESMQINNNNNNNANVGLIDENYLLPPTTTVTVDEFIITGTSSSEGASASATVNGGDNDSWRYLITKHNTEELEKEDEELVETDHEKRIMYDTMSSCLQNDDDDIMVVVEEASRSRGAAYGGGGNSNMVGFNNDFDSYQDFVPENLEVGFEENKDCWNGMLSYNLLVNNIAS